MSYRTDWGLFTADGTPVAVGNEWHKWKCPKQEFEPSGYEHCFTGEWIDTGFIAVPCPWKHVAVKKDQCSKCSMEFIYP